MNTVNSYKKPLKFHFFSGFVLILTLLLKTPFACSQGFPANTELRAPIAILTSMAAYFAAQWAHYSYQDYKNPHVYRLAISDPERADQYRKFMTQCKEWQFNLLTRYKTCRNNPDECLSYEEHAEALMLLSQMDKYGYAMDDYSKYKPEAELLDIPIEFETEHQIKMEQCRLEQNIILERFFNCKWYQEVRLGTPGVGRPFSCLSGDGMTESTRTRKHLKRSLEMLEE